MIEIMRIRSLADLILKIFYFISWALLAHYFYLLLKSLLHKGEPMQTFKKSVYRQRVYQDKDANINLVFGDEPAPQNLDGSDQKLLADHDIVDMCQVTDHVSTS